MKRKALYSIIAVVIIAAAASAVIIWKPWSSSNTNANANANGNTNVTVAAPTVTYQGTDGKNALDLLKASHQVVDDNGFVTSIDGVSNAAPKYWTLYVNGSMAQVGAKDLVTKSSDTITWKLEAFTQ